MCTLAYVTTTKINVQFDFSFSSIAGISNTEYKALSKNKLIN